jgi:hypothetical protein
MHGRACSPPYSNSLASAGGGLNSDLLVVFFACSMQNAPGDSTMSQMDFRIKLNILPSKATCIGAQAGCGDDATSLYSYTKT